MIIAVEALVPILILLIFGSWTWFWVMRTFFQHHPPEPVPERRPWGSFTILLNTPYTKVKTITVNPGHRLSLQSHEKREEHWVVVKGEAMVTLDNSTSIAFAGEHIMIPLSAKHRIEARGKEPLVFVEVQVGTYFGEDDIVRYEDDYKRT